MCHLYRWRVCGQIYVSYVFYSLKTADVFVSQSRDSGGQNYYLEISGTYV